MKTIYFLMILFFSFSVNAQLVFENDIANGSTPKFVVNTANNTTQIFLMSGGVSKLAYTWNKVPLLFDDADRTNRYKMTVVESDRVAKRTFEVHYSLYRETQAYMGYVKQTINFHDKRATKIIESNFKVAK